MYIEAISNQYGNDLYGTLKCEHCGSTEKLSGGYNDHFWHSKVLPSFHCTSCRKNRAGDMPSPEVQHAAQADGVNGVPTE